MKRVWGLCFFLSTSFFGCFSLMALDSFEISDPTFDRLLTNMASGDTQKRFQAKNQLVALCQEGHWDQLLPYLNSLDRIHRLSSLEVAGLLDESSPQILQAVAVSLTSKDDTLHRQAIKTLGYLGSPHAVSLLVDHLSSQNNPEVIVLILNALADTQKTSAGESVVTYLKHANLSVRYAAAKTLWNLKPAQVKNQVIRLSQQESDPQIKAYLLAYLVAVKSSVGQSLKDFVDVRDGLLRELVREAYVAGQDHSIMTAWLAVMAHDSWRVRLDAAKGFEVLAQPQHIKQLIFFLNDPHPDVRDQVALALRKVSGYQFGFQGHASDSERQQAIKRWQSWWQESAYLYDQEADS